MTHHPANPDTNRKTSFQCSVLTLFVLFFGLCGTVHSDSFTELPWGYDSAAGSCVVCHSLEEGGEFRVAPNLWDIVGDEKARDRTWYAYSPALIRKGGTWTVEELDDYLADANQFIPGTTKSIKVQNDEEREEIIELLSQLNN